VIYFPQIADTVVFKALMGSEERQASQNPRQDRYEGVIAILAAEKTPQSKEKTPCQSYST
jgi:hypothetical protein